MSLYESSNKNVSINSFFSNARLPIWVLVIAAYLALTTFINQISNLSSYIVEGVFEAKYLWGILGNLTGLISIVALLTRPFLQASLMIGKYFSCVGNGEC